MPEPQLPAPQAIERPPRPEVLLQTIRRLFQAGRVSWKTHAKWERMPERDFDRFDVEDVLMSGYTPEPVFKGAYPNEWGIKVVGNLEGTKRKMGVVCVVAGDRLLIIVTTEWEDR